MIGKSQKSKLKYGKTFRRSVSVFNFTFKMFATLDFYFDFKPLMNLSLGLPTTMLIALLLMMHCLDQFTMQQLMCNKIK